MLKKTITYEDFEGTKRVEDFYFNLTKAELIEMEVSAKDGLQAAINRIVKAENKEELIKEFKAIIMKAYGEKSDDGRHFHKSPEMAATFANSAAYDALFLELATDENAGVIFIKGMLPRDFVEASERAEKTKVQDKPQGPPPFMLPKPPQPPMPPTS